MDVGERSSSIVNKVRRVLRLFCTRTQPSSRLHASVSSNRWPSEYGSSCNGGVTNAALRASIASSSSLLDCGNVSGWYFFERLFSSAAISVQLRANCRKSPDSLWKDLNLVMLAGGLSPRIASVAWDAGYSRLRHTTWPR